MQPVKASPYHIANTNAHFHLVLTRSTYSHTLTPRRQLRLRKKLNGKNYIFKVLYRRCKTDWLGNGNFARSISQISPNSTWLVMSRLARHHTFDVSSPCILAVSSCRTAWHNTTSWTGLTHSSRHARHVKRVVLRQAKWNLVYTHYISIFTVSMDRVCLLLKSYIAQNISLRAFLAVDPLKNLGVHK